MKKITFCRETIRKLDDRVLEKVQGGEKYGLQNTTRGRACPLLTSCTLTC